MEANVTGYLWHGYKSGLSPGQLCYVALYAVKMSRTRKLEHRRSNQWPSQPTTEPKELPQTQPPPPQNAPLRRTVLGGEVCWKQEREPPLDTLHGAPRLEEMFTHLPIAV